MEDTFVAFIEGQRKRLRLSKSALAERAGLSRQGLYKILQGDVEHTSLSTLIKLSVPLQVHPLYLIQKLFANWKMPSYTTNGCQTKGMATGFIADVTYPDNTIVNPGQQFTKTWRVQNLGDKAWESCALVCFDEDVTVATTKASTPLMGQTRNLQPETRQLAIPHVAPREVVDISVNFTAPSHPCTVISYWKMVDANNVICFPNSEGLTCLVQVVSL